MTSLKQLEHLKKLNVSKIGTKQSEVTKEKIRQSKLGKKRPPFTEEHKRKMRESHKGKHDYRGEKNPSYIDGRRSDKEYKIKRHRKRCEKLAGRKKPEQCEICGAIGRICFDHDHKTGEFRGWICNRCNVALAMVNDNVETLKLLIKYLKS
ncbi:MAG TPA: hypothetical protein ENH85_11585 [Candidatus Scalindua sp.]|nr:hypothetical protein [Candidatus Scalindua sp.]